MAEIRLPDLETIKRFSIAVRSEHADADEVIDALRTDLQALLQATGRLRSKDEPAQRTVKSPPKAAPSRPIERPLAKKPAPKRTVAKKPVARKPVARKSVARRAPTKTTRRSR